MLFRNTQKKRLWEGTARHKNAVRTASPGLADRCELDRKVGVKATKSRREKSSHPHTHTRMNDDDYEA